MTYIKLFNNSKNHFPRFESDKLIDIWGLAWLGGPKPDKKKIWPKVQIVSFTMCIVLTQDDNKMKSIHS